MGHHTTEIADPLKFRLAGLLAACLGSMGRGSDDDDLFSDTGLAGMMTRPPEPDMGDYALPCFRLAKILRKSPVCIAGELAAALENTPDHLVEKAVQRQAFLNITLDKGALSRFLLPGILDGSFFQVLKKENQPTHRRVMIEYSQPNTHKEFHIGHGRNVSLGESVARLFDYTGHKVFPVNYIGDEGTHVAKCLWMVREDLDRGVREPEQDFSRWYGQRYVAANQRLEAADPAEKKVYQQKISEILAGLEAKSGPWFELWRKSRRECLREFRSIYDWLGAWFEHDFFESEVSEGSQKIVDEAIEKGLFTESDGAWGINLESEGLGFFMARKSDGTSLYITKDLALARKKFEEYDIDRSIYVVGSEQNFHFRQLFSVLKKMGFRQAGLCHHLSYAHVALPDGKMSSRKGNVMPFRSLVAMIRKEVDCHLQKYTGSWSREELEGTARKLCVAAIKYGMLAADPQKEIVFDPKAWTSFEGNSGAYLLYCYSRASSILRECQKKGVNTTYDHLERLRSPGESGLLTQMYDFNIHVLNACETYRPSVMANYLFNFCKAFNRFYATHSVLNAENSQLRSARMTLVAAFRTTLKKGLELLGIQTAERM